MTGVVTMLWGGSPGNRSLIPGSDKTYLSPPMCPDRLWSPPSSEKIYPLDVNLPERESDGNLYILSRLGMRGNIPSLLHVPLYRNFTSLLILFMLGMLNVYVCWLTFCVMQQFPVFSITRSLSQLKKKSLILQADWRGAQKCSKSLCVTSELKELY
jgi:hypothetical protein